MIKNDQQLSITLGKIDGMRSRLSRLRKKYPLDSDYEFYAEATRRHIDQMESEVRLYQVAKSGDVDALIQLWNDKGQIRPTNKDDLALGDFISLLRVARGLTQAELAKKLGIDQAHVARYERDDYSGYTIETLDKIFCALGVRFTLGKIKLPEAA